MSELWSGNKALDALRSRAAGSATGCTSVSIEELNAVWREMDARAAPASAKFYALVKRLAAVNPDDINSHIDGLQDEAREILNNPTSATGPKVPNAPGWWRRRTDEQIVPVEVIRTPYYEYAVAQNFMWRDRRSWKPVIADALWEGPCQREGGEIK